MLDLVAEEEPDPWLTGADDAAEVGPSHRRGGADSAVLDLVAEEEPDPWLGVTARRQRPATRKQTHVNPKGGAQRRIKQQRKGHATSKARRAHLAATAREQAATKQAYKDVGARLQRWMDELATKAFSVSPVMAMEEDEGSGREVRPPIAVAAAA